MLASHEATAGGTSEPPSRFDCRWQPSTHMPAVQSITSFDLHEVAARMQAVSLAS